MSKEGELTLENQDLIEKILAFHSHEKKEETPSTLKKLR
jgi:hypothetical protein